jgi:hypothetical protein
MSEERNAATAPAQKVAPAKESGAS